MSAAVSVPLLVQGAIDRGILGHHQGALVKWTMAILAVGLAQGAFVGLRRYLAFLVSYKVEADLRNRLFGHLQRLHFAFHDRTQTGQLMSRAASDLTQIQNFVVLIPLTLANILILVSVVSVLFIENWFLAILALMVLPLIPILARRFSGRVFPASLSLQRELGHLAEIVEETLSGIRVIKGFGTENLQDAKLRGSSQKVYQSALEAGRIRAFFTPLLTFLPIIGLVLVVYAGGHEVLNGTILLGQLTAFLLYVNLLVAPLQLPAWVIGQGQRAVASAQRVMELLRTDSMIVDPPNPQRLPRESAGEIEFSGVTFFYDRELARNGGGGHQESSKPVLDNFNLRVEAGSSIALVGPTGCGKSTVARLISRFYDVASGTITIDGLDITQVALKDLRSSVGIVFEDTFLFSDTVRANIAFADPRAPLDLVISAASQAGIDEFIRSLDDGYDTVIGERGFSLSGGQRQRLALARAILSNPRILILDDATSAVDPSKEQEILRAMSQVMEGRTTIIIAHRPSTIALAEQVAFMDKGRVLAQGTHQQLLEDVAQYRDLLISRVETK